MVYPASLITTAFARHAHAFNGCCFERAAACTDDTWLLAAAPHPLHGCACAAGAVVAP